MLRVKGTEVIIDDFSGLLRGNPLDWIMEGLKELAENAFQERNYFSSIEPWLSSFEDVVYKLDPGLYYLIAKESSKPSEIDKLLGLSEYALMVMDALSFREAFLLSRNFSKWNMIIKCNCAPLPTDTKFFSLRYLGTESPSELKRKKNLPFYFEEIANKEDISKIDPTKRDKTILWVREPDKTLHEFREGFKTAELTQAYDKARDLVEASANVLLETFQEVHITSDHGYITDPHSWRNLENFPSDQRYTPNIPDRLKPYCRKCGEYWLLVGRYNTVKRGRHSNIRHGGLSIPEALTPLVTVSMSSEEKQ